MSGPTEVHELLHEVADRWARPGDGPYERIQARAGRIRRHRRVRLVALSGAGVAVVLLIGPALAARGAPPGTAPGAVPAATHSWPPGCGSPATGMTTIDGTPWPANQDHLDSIAQAVDSYANAHFGGSYNGDELVLETDQIRVYRVPDRGLDTWLRSTYGPSCVVLVDAAHPKAQLQALMDRIEADTSYWQSRGVRINMVGLLPQGTVQVGTLDVAKARQEFPGRYGPDAPIVVIEQGPATAGTG